MILKVMGLCCLKSELTSMQSHNPVDARSFIASLLSQLAPQKKLGNMTLIHLSIILHIVYEQNLAHL